MRVYDMGHRTKHQNHGGRRQEEKPGNLASIRSVAMIPRRTLLVIGGRVAGQFPVNSTCPVKITPWLLSVVNHNKKRKLSNKYMQPSEGCLEYVNVTIVLAVCLP